MKRKEKKSRAKPDTFAQGFHVSSSPFSHHAPFVAEYLPIQIK
jgi:hypothetical protein